eukprot:3310499-Amphidinium_carterae.1
MNPKSFKTTSTTMTTATATADSGQRTVDSGQRTDKTKKLESPPTPRRSPMQEEKQWENTHTKREQISFQGWRFLGSFGRVMVSESQRLVVRRGHGSGMYVSPTAEEFCKQPDCSLELYPHPLLQLRFHFFGELCVHCGEAVEDFEHIVHHCPPWAAERRAAALPAHAQDAPPCVKLHGLLPAPQKPCIIIQEPVLVPGLVSTLCGLMFLVDTVVTRTFAGVELGTTLTLVKMSCCPCRGLSNQSIVHLATVIDGLAVNNMAKRGMSLFAPTGAEHDWSDFFLHLLVLSLIGHWSSEGCKEPVRIPKIRPVQKA